MNREESLKEFKESISILLNQCEEEFEENFKKNKIKTKKIIIDSLKEVIQDAKRISHNDSEYKLAFLNFEFLRVSVLDESFRVFLHGYDESLYLDTNDVGKYIDLKFLFSPFLEVKEKLTKEKKVYMGKVNDYDIEQLILNLAVKCYKSMINSVRNWLWDLDENDWINQSSVDDSYIIQWGEYQGASEIVFAMDNKKKTIEELLELKKLSKEKYPFVYTVWKNSQLENGELNNINMMLINFKGSKLKKLNFSGSNIMRGQLKGSELKECEFKDTIFSGASFENAKIENCNFENSNLISANFRGSKIQSINFENADLTNANFINADIKQVSFKNAKVNKAVFSRKDIPFIHLTPEQLQDIYIDGGK